MVFSRQKQSVKPAKPRASWALFPSRSSADLCKLFYTEQWCGLYGWLLAANPGSSRDLWERKVRGWTAPLRVYDRDNNYCTKHAGWSSGSCSDMLKRQGSWWSHSPLWLMWLLFQKGSPQWVGLHVWCWISLMTQPQRDLCLCLQ